jgi:signal transduction histidine kinase
MAEAQVESTLVDRRARMVLAVLSGRNVNDVAAQHSVPVDLVQRWTEQFVAAGGRALAARQVADPATADHLLAVVAHEIRTPLTSASMALRLLGAEGVGPERRAELADLVSRQLDVLGQLANDVLDGASVALGRLGLMLHPIDLFALVTDVCADLGEERVPPPTGLPIRIVGDANRLRQVVANLLHNALRYGVGEVRTSVVVSADHAVISIVNHTAERISREDATHWFEPFAKGSTRTGHGLGLYVVRALTVAHGGTAGLDSLECSECESGQNLKVWVRVPLAGPPPLGYTDAVTLPEQRDFTTKQGDNR